MIANEYGKLKEIWIGREYPETFKNIPLGDDFKKFYEKDASFNPPEYQKECLNNIDIRNKELDIFAETLEKRGVVVHRPDTDIPNKYYDEHREYISFGSNLRDLVFTIKDYLIITLSPMELRRKEYLSLSRLISSEINNKKIITVPDISRDYLKKDDDDYPFLDINQFKDGWEDYYPVFEAANMLKHDNQIIMNISNKNEYAGFKYLERVTDVKIHPVYIDKHHIDGALNILNGNTALLCYNSSVFNKQQFINHLPDFMKDFDFINVDKNPHGHKTSKNRVIASLGGMFINVLSLDENTVVVNKDAVYLIQELENRGFDVIKLPCTKSRLFGGGFHCVSLDTLRLP